MAVVDPHESDQSLLLLPSKLFSHEEEEEDHHQHFSDFNEQKYHHQVPHHSTATSSTTATNTYCWSSCSDSGSDSSSPFHSELGSHDSSEDYTSKLTRQMAHYMLQDDDHQQTCLGSSGSWESTIWSSPISPSQKPSPQPVPIMMEEFKQINIMKKDHKEHIPCHSYRDGEIPFPLSNQNAEFQSKQALINDQIRAIQEMKQLEQRKKLKHYKAKGKACDGGGSSSKGTNLNPIRSTPEQQQPGSGMRGVFLDESGSSCGTGVFLPRGTGYSSESRKKQGFSTVLIPARVVHSLKQHFDKVGVPRPSRLYGSFLVQNDGLNLMGERNNSLYSQRQNQQSWQEKANMNQQELLLPQEWTY